MSVRDGRLTAWNFWGDNYAMLMTPSAPTDSSFRRHARVLASRSRRPQSWHVIDGEGRRLLELQLVKFDIGKDGISLRSPASTEAMNWT